MIITGPETIPGGRIPLVGDQIQKLSKGGINIKPPELGIDWMANHFRVGRTSVNGQQWRFTTSTHGARRRLTGPAILRLSTLVSRGGPRSWSTSGTISRASGKGAGPVEGDNDHIVTTSFALLFLAKGRAPVLVNKLRHGPRGDWNHDQDDIRNLVGLVSRDWKNLLTWQVVDPGIAAVEDLMQAPILYFNGHEAPEVQRRGQEGPPRVRRAGWVPVRRGLLRAARVRPRIPRPHEGALPRVRAAAPPLAEDHAVWRARHVLSPRSTRSGASSSAAGPW